MFFCLLRFFSKDSINKNLSKKSCIREIVNVLTCADIRINTKTDRKDNIFLLTFFLGGIGFRGIFLWGRGRGMVKSFFGKSGPKKYIYIYS